LAPAKRQKPSGGLTAREQSRRGPHRMLTNRQPKYRALITGINLGSSNIDGWGVARHEKDDPGFAAVYMSRNDAAVWASNGVSNSIVLEEPFAPAQLVTAVSQLLNSAAPPV
jgi:hypothetical protein